MALSLKPGVLFEEIHERIVEALPTLERIYAHFGKTLVITSARDGKHKAGSLHYEGKAIDLRTRDFTPLRRQDVHFECQNQLGVDFDVVLEKDHIHCEFDVP